MLPLRALHVAASAAGLIAQTNVGIFEGQTDIGVVTHPGTVQFDESKRAYRLKGSGENMWAAADEFHFVWKRIDPTGDVTLTADISVVTAVGNGHRKGVLMIRQSLDADSAYVSAALHGDGLASLQSRPEKGGPSYEIQSNTARPATMRLAKRGDNIYFYAAESGHELKFSGGSMRLHLTEPFFVGLGVCAHQKDAIVEVEFGSVQLDLSRVSGHPQRYSTVEAVPYPSGDRRAIYAAKGTLRGPVWSRDGASIFVNHDGGIERVAVHNGEPIEKVEAGAAIGACDSFTGVSPDGKRLGMTCGAHESVYVKNLDGKATLKRITHKVPTRFHGWSPDGRMIAYSLERKGKRDIYLISAMGHGKEIRVGGNIPGSNDNPEYSPDGKFIYFNSDRGGSIQVWRTAANGSRAAEPVTGDDEFSNWQPHVSPDGRRVLVLSCEKGTKELPENQAVLLRVFAPETKRFQVVARILMGGRGTIDSPAWSPDGRRIAFVTYQFLP